MKTFKTAFFSLLFIVISCVGLAQTKTETFKVAGECGMCKKKIESSAKTAGATYASWSTESKVLTVKYNSTFTNKAKIEKAIAAVGYDTPDYKTTEEAYNGLHECCKYERESASSAHACCDNAKCTESACMKEGKCAKDAACCKEAGCDKKDCCTKS
jgi:hypothetical protein